MSKAYYTLGKLIAYFLVAAFVGWLYEISCVYIMYGTYYDRGVLHLPLCPIYGFGIVLLYFLFKNVKNGLYITIGSGLITTGIELITSYIAEFKFNMILWTYEDWPLNFQGRISLISSVIFGLMALFFFKVVRPVIEKVFDKAGTVYAATFWYLLLGILIIIELLSHFPVYLQITLV